MKCVDIACGFTALLCPLCANKKDTLVSSGTQRNHAYKHIKRIEALIFSQTPQCANLQTNAILVVCSVIDVMCLTFFCMPYCFFHIALIKKSTNIVTYNPYEYFYMYIQY